MPLVPSLASSHLVELVQLVSSASILWYTALQASEEPRLLVPLLALAHLSRIKLPAKPSSVARRSAEELILLVPSHAFPHLANLRPLASSVPVPECAVHRSCRE